MADNTTLPGTGEVIRNIDKLGKKTQVVTLDLGGSGAESLIAGSIPVTGAFYQATQPVSGTVGVSGSVAVTGSFYQATQPVSGTFWQTTQPVSGTFWQATQPVSIASMPTTPVTGSFWQATQPVSGTFWQATQPVSIASMPSTPVTGTFWQTTQPVSLASLPALAAGTNNVGRMTPATLVARTLVTINYNATNAAAADTLLATLSVNRAGTVTTGQTSVAVTSGKTLRLTGALIFCRTTTAALPWGVLTLRMNPSGAAVIGSGVVAQFGASGTAAVIGNAGSTNPCFDEGLEFSGTQQIGLSYANNVATNVTAITLFGYEYTTPS